MLRTFHFAVQVIAPVSCRSTHNKQPLDQEWKAAATKELKGKKDIDSLIWKTPEVRPSKFKAEMMPLTPWVYLY